jgi:hypothetical protein
VKLRTTRINHPVYQKKEICTLVPRHYIKIEELQSWLESHISKKKELDRKEKQIKVRGFIFEYQLETLEELLSELKEVINNETGYTNRCI